MSRSSEPLFIVLLVQPDLSRIPRNIELWNSGKSVQLMKFLELNLEYYGFGTVLGKKSTVLGKKSTVLGKKSIEF